MVIGDGQGTVGLGYGKAKEAGLAVQKGIEEAKKNLFTVPLAGSTITHPVLGRGRGRPGAAQAGRARAPASSPAARPGPSSRWPASTTSWPSPSGSSNSINVAQATVAGLRALKRPDEIARLRGKSPEEVTPGRRVAGLSRDPAGPARTRRRWRDGCEPRSRSPRSSRRIGTKPKHRGTLRALGLHGIGSTQHPARPPGDPGHDRPGPAPGQVGAGVGGSSRVKSSRPEAGARLDPAAAAGRARHRRQGRQDRRPGHQGPGRPRQRQARLRGRPAAADAAHPEAQGLQEPVPGGVQRDQPGHPGRLRRRRGRARRPCGPAGLVHKHGLVKVLGRGELTRRLDVSAHAFSPSAPRRPSRRLAAGSRCCPRRSATAGPPAKGNALTNR